MTLTTQHTVHDAVRRATPDDADVVLAMVREIAAHEGDLHHVHVTAATWRQLLERPDVVVLLAERDGHPVGYVSGVRRLHLWSGGDLLALDDLYVRPGARDRGTGRRLLTAFAALAAPERLLVRWEVLPDNDDAQRFYRRLGATLRPKLVAGWSYDQYRDAVEGAHPHTDVDATRSAP